MPLMLWWSAYKSTLTYFSFRQVLEICSSYYTSFGNLDIGNYSVFWISSARLCNCIDCIWATHVSDITWKVNKPRKSMFITINDAFSIISLPVQWFPLIEFAFFCLRVHTIAPPAASCPFQCLCFLCFPAGNTLCKSGNIAVFGNVVYSGLLNDHLWHLGVPLFTRLVRAAGTLTSILSEDFHAVLLNPKQASGAEFPSVSNRLLLMPALLPCVGWSYTGCDGPRLWMWDYRTQPHLSVLFHISFRLQVGKSHVRRNKRCEISGHKNKGEVRCLD